MILFLEVCKYEYIEYYKRVANDRHDCQDKATEIPIPILHDT